MPRERLPGGKVKQRVLANLENPSTLEEALENARGLLELVQRCLSELGSDWSVVEKQVLQLRRQVEVLERLVSETSRRRDIPDTTNGHGGA